MQARGLLKSTLEYIFHKTMVSQAITLLLQKHLNRAWGKLESDQMDECEECLNIEGVRKNASRIKVDYLTSFEYSTFSLSWTICKWQMYPFPLLTCNFIPLERCLLCMPEKMDVQNGRICSAVCSAVLLNDIVRLLHLRWPRVNDVFPGKNPCFTMFDGVFSMFLCAALNINAI